MLTREQVVAIAELARLALTEEEIMLYQEQLSAVLGYAERLQTLDTDAIPPTATVLPVQNVMRADKPCPSMAANLGSARKATMLISKPDWLVWA